MNDYISDNYCLASVISKEDVNKIVIDEISQGKFMVTPEKP